MIGRTVIVPVDDFWPSGAPRFSGHRVTVHVQIDEIAIVDEIAKRAAKNSTGHSTAQGGHIIARVITKRWSA